MLTEKQREILVHARDAAEVSLHRNSFMRACHAAGAKLNNASGSLHISFGEHNLRLGRGIIFMTEDTAARFALRRIAEDLLAQQHLN